MRGWIAAWLGILSFAQCEAVSPLRSPPVAKIAEPADLDSLRYLQVVWRHGDRSPAFVFDPADEKKWPDGLGELTKEGIRQQFRMGKWLRQRYGSWLGDHFDRKQIYVRSSDYNRTLMSALANMAGLYLPRPEEQWDQKIDWQPVPVHTIPKPLDKELCEDISCPLASAEETKVYQTELALEIAKNHSNFIAFLAEKTGLKDLRFSDLWKVFDALNCESFHNDTSPWPAWVNQSIFDRLRNLYDVESSFKFHTELLRKLRGGPLLKEIYERFVAKVNGNLGNNAKMYAYSAHDTTLAALLSSFGIYPPVFPLYATMIIMELHLIKGYNVLKLFHKNITDSEQLFEYAIPGCEDPCTLEGLYDDLSKYFPSDWASDCQVSSNLAWIGSVVAISLVFILVLGCYFCNQFWRRIWRFRVRHNGENSLIADDDNDLEA